jgi:hypothetical protein
MKKSSFLENGVVFLLMAGAALLVAMACSVKVMPDPVPSVKGVQTASFSGVALAIHNVERDASNYDILTDKGVKLGFIGNRQLWLRKLIDSLSGELARRGALIAPKAPVKITIALPDITLIESRGVYQIRVQVAVASRGWSKKYEGTAESRLAFFESADTMASRTAGWALANVVKSILADDEFQNQVGRQSRRSKHELLSQAGQAGIACH